MTGRDYQPMVGAGDLEELFAGQQPGYTNPWIPPPRRRGWPVLARRFAVWLPLSVAAGALEAGAGWGLWRLVLRLKGLLP